ncbi:hypothetical protein [Mycobacterium sp. DL592]|uniref:hypothetical protein n=1 Tax=Mycobacterium sp. DL592 TaxID=2675524 RepID=UPI00142349D9|nr:hypothetical protein [Mycobacterium sp. DL592]
MLGAGSAAGSTAAAPDDPLDDVVSVLVVVTLAECATVVAFSVVVSVADVAVVDEVVDAVDAVVPVAAAAVAAAVCAVEESCPLVLPPDDDTLLLRAEWAVVFLAVVEESLDVESDELLSELAEALLALPPAAPVSA